MDNTTLKELLYCVFKIDNIVNRFHNKVQFMNFSLLMQRADGWDQEKQEKVYAAIQQVLAEMEKIPSIIDDLNQPVLDLIDSYAFEPSREFESSIED